MNNQIDKNAPLAIYGKIKLFLLRLTGAALWCMFFFWISGLMAENGMLDWINSLRGWWLGNYLFGILRFVWIAVLWIGIQLIFGRSIGN